MFHVKHWEIGAENAYFLFLIEIAKKKLFLLLKYIGKRLDWIMSREQSNARQGGGISQMDLFENPYKAESEDKE